MSNVCVFSAEKIYQNDGKDTYRKISEVTPQYDADRAVSWAKENVEKRVGGKPAGFISECLTEGGLSVNEDDIYALRFAICKTSLIEKETVTYGGIKSNNGVVRDDGENEGKIALGDVLIYDYLGDEPGEAAYEVHTRIVTEIVNHNVYATGVVESGEDDSYVSAGDFDSFISEDKKNDGINGYITCLHFDKGLKVSAVACNYSSTAVVTEDGQLWTFGINSHGSLGIGKEEYMATHDHPIKIMDDVEKIEMGSQAGAAIKKDSSLWMWGNGKAVNGTGTNCNSPIKIMDDVESICIGDISAAIKKDGSLWIWGEGYGIPRHIMDNVASVDIEERISIIKKDGTLYYWDNLNEKELFELEPSVIAGRFVKVAEDVLSVDGYYYIKKDNSLWRKVFIPNTDPVKIMDDVVDISNISGFIFSVKTDGTVYEWADRQKTNSLDDLFLSPEHNYGTIARDEPVETVLDNINMIKLSWDHAAAVTNNGDLWMWGDHAASSVLSDENYVFNYPEDKIRLYKITIHDTFDGNEENSWYSVKFDSLGGSFVDSQTIDKGDKIVKPADPTKSGYTFAGWYTSDSFTEQWDFDADIVVSDVKLYAKWISKDESGFTLKKDNNSFYHTNGKGGGLEGKKNYSLNDASYYNALADVFPSYRISDLKRSFDEEWKGSCHGIASTMGLMYLKKAPAGLISKTDASCYYALPKPRDDARFMDAINYYQTSQCFTNLAKTETYRTRYDGVIQEVFLKELCETVKENNAVIFCYSIPGTCHAILALDSYDNSDGKHIVKLYDMNSFDSSTGGEYSYMEISEDYSAFSFTDGNGSLADQKNYKWLCYRDWDKIGKLTDALPSLAVLAQSDNEESSDTENHAWISIAGDTVISNRKGKSLKVDDGDVGGDMAVYDINHIVEDDNSRLIVEVDDNEEFTLEGSTQDVSIGSEKGYMSVEGSGFSGVKMSYSDGVALEGDSYDFKVFVQTDNVIKGKEKGLGSISGKGTGKALFKKDGSSVTGSTDGSFSDVDTMSYTGIRKAGDKVSGDVKTVSVDTDNDPDDPDNPDNPDNPEKQNPDTNQDRQDTNIQTKEIEADGYKVTVSLNSSIPFVKKKNEVKAKLTVSVDARDPEGVNAGITIKSIKATKPKNGSTKVTIKLKGSSKPERKAVKIINKSLKKIPVTVEGNAYEK